MDRLVVTVRSLVPLTTIVVMAGMAAGQSPAGPTRVGNPSPQPSAAYTLDDLVKFAVERNPRLARAAFAIDAAHGRYTQAGLYPNPVLAVTGDELGDRQGPGGIWTAPQLTQEVVTGRKLTLSQAVAAKEIDRATLDLMAERYSLIGAVRAAYYEVYALQRRAEALGALVHLAEQSLDQGKKLRASRLDLNQLEIDLERYRADAEAVERELPAAYQKLGAVVGTPRLPARPLTGAYDDALPDYDLDKVRETVLAVHPEVRAARVAVERAQLALRRALAEPVPNLTLTSGYVRQNQNRSDDWMIGVSMPLPLWNRNQGNVRAARAEVGMAAQDVGRAENDLADRLATVFRTYNSARRRAEKYKSSILPRAEENYDLLRQAFDKGGQFEYLRVLQAQRAVVDARLEYNRALGDAWRAAGEISGFLLEEAWPVVPASSKPIPDSSAPRR